MSSTNVVVRFYRLFLVYLGANFPSLVKAKDWDEQYARGDWDVLSTDTVQMGHHMVVLGFLQRTRRNPRILDVGCGAGPLFEFVTRLGLPFERYLGIDISSEATKRASQLPTPGGSEFQAADAQEFTTDEKFDAIIFNEVAWYFKDAGAVLARYAGFLREGGVMILSMYDILPARSMWRSVDRHFDTVDAIQVKNKFHTWNVRLLAKRA
jgi:2-polyprenyl-3-methyl-5-hydroxy-6-metoxy-1,4-benzoquinol methylase